MCLAKRTWLSSVGRQAITQVPDGVAGFDESHGGRHKACAAGRFQVVSDERGITTPREREVMWRAANTRLQVAKLAPLREGGFSFSSSSLSSSSLVKAPAPPGDVIPGSMPWKFTDGWGGRRFVITGVFRLTSVLNYREQESMPRADKLPVPLSVTVSGAGAFYDFDNAHLRGTISPEHADYFCSEVTPCAGRFP